MRVCERSVCAYPHETFGGGVRVTLCMCTHNLFIKRLSEGVLVHIKQIKIKQLTRHIRREAAKKGKGVASHKTPKVKKKRKGRERSPKEAFGVASSKTPVMTLAP